MYINNSHYLNVSFFLNIILATTGWNIWNVIFDFTGGILSLLQLVLDSVDLHDLRHGILGNWAKLVLSLITLCFDVSMKSNFKFCLL